MNDYTSLSLLTSSDGLCDCDRNEDNCGGVDIMGC